MAKRTAKERREALAAWLDKVERQVKARLRKLKLPDDIDGLREHLPSLLQPKIKPPSLPAKNVDEYEAMIPLVKEVRRSTSFQQGYDLLCCLACLRNYRSLLKRREPEGIAVQAYVLGARAQIAGLRPVIITAYKAAAAQVRRREASAKVRRDKVEENRTIALERYEHFLAKNPGKKEAAINFAARKLKVSPRTARRYITGK